MEQQRYRPRLTVSPPPASPSHTADVAAATIRTMPSSPRMLSSPPMTPVIKNEDDPVIKPASRKDFIHAYAQMVPHLRPEGSRLAGRKRAPTTTTEIDEWEGVKRHRFTLDVYQSLKPRTIILDFDNHSRKGSPRHLCEQGVATNSNNDHAPTTKSDMLGGRKRSSRGRGPSVPSRDMSHKNTVVAPKCRRARQHNHTNTAAPSTSCPPAATHRPVKSTSSPSRQPPSPSPPTSTTPESTRRPSRGEVYIKGFTLKPEYAYDTLDIDSDDQDYYPPEWLPMVDHLEKVSVDISWKGQPLLLDEQDRYLSRLHPSEKHIVSHLRLAPIQYIRCKRAIIMAAREFSKHAIEFRRSDAQKVCRIDVNKSSKLWGVFEAYGWLHPHSHQS